MNYQYNYNHKSKYNKLMVILDKVLLKQNRNKQKQLINKNFLLIFFSIKTHKLKNLAMTHLTFVLILITKTLLFKQIKVIIQNNLL